MGDTPAKILIVEDDRYISKMYQLKLSLDGFDVQVADNGRVGIEKVKEFRPDIILTDILMPEMDGFDVIKAVKGDSEFAGVPILIMSNLGQEDHIQKGLELGAIGYIVKSQVTPSKVVDKIKETLAGKFVQE